MLQPLTAATLTHALADLTSRDPLLARIVAVYGPPPLWPREPGFGTLLHIILEQQVSLASAQAAFDRLLIVAAPLTPERFLALDDATLKTVGFSRQKITYGRSLAQAILSRQLDLDGLTGQDDDAARAALVRVKGIGRWTADIYLLLALRRPDVWPSGDLALAAAVQGALGLSTMPRPAELETIGEQWRPWRAVAARLLWHFYLSGGARKAEGDFVQLLPPRI
jgi:DNA-3-methyladenine glycosylase II